MKGRQAVRRVAILLVSVLVILSVAVMIRTTRQGRTAPGSPWLQLLSLLNADRPFEPRLTGLPFARWIQVRSGSKSETQTASPELLLVAALLEKQIQRDQSPLVYKQAAVARLLLNEWDASVSLLERAVAMAPEDAALRSDLAAAYLVRATATGASRDLVRALDSGKRATVANPAAPEGWFNLGLALERLGLSEAARHAWQQAAAIGSDEWTREAAWRTGRLPRDDGRAGALAQIEPIVAQGDSGAMLQAVSTQPDLAGEVFERRILRDWAEAVRAHHTRRARLVARRARDLARDIRRVTGDTLCIELIAALNSCAGTRCAAGWLSHLQALEKWERDDYAGARAASGRADVAFGNEKSPVNASRVLVQAMLDRTAGHTTKALARLQTLEPYAVGHGSWGLAGRMRWQIGLLASEAGDLGKAIADYLSAAALLRRARDREGEAVVEAMLALKYEQLDELDRAWNHEARALSGLSITRPLRRNPILSIAAILAGSNDLNAAAIAFRAPLIAEARRAGSSASLAFRLAEDAANLKNLGFLQVARSELQEAIQHAGAIQDPGTASMARAVIRIQEARLVGDDAPARSAAILQEAIDIYRQRGDTFAMPALQLDRGRALVRAGRLEEAEGAFADGLAAAERERRGVSTETDRIASLSARWDLYAWLVDLRLQRHEEDNALALLERARAANLAENLKLSAVSEAVHLPARTIAIEYAILPSGVVGWVSTSSLRERFAVASSVDTLTRLIEEYRAAIKSRASNQSLGTLSQEIFTIVFGPIRDRVTFAEHIVIVPDGPLHDLPFASLQDPRTGRFVVEHASILVTPSLTFYSRYLAASVPRGTPLSALVIGNPNRAGAAADNLPNLQASEDEARAVAALYPTSLVAVREQATRQYFVNNAPHARVVHFAGHALFSETRPDLSRLLLAPSHDDPLGALFAADIERLRLTRVRLVVLSACETARGHLARGEGVVGLVRAFLTAGVPSVIATLWPVDDKATATMFKTFHQAWSRGTAAAEALRQAQLQLLRDDRMALADWAGAVAVGQSVTP